MTKNVLVPLDGSTLADAAVPHAIEVARRLGASLRVVRVHTPMALVTAESQPIVIPDSRIEHEVVTTKRAWLDARVNEIRKASGLTVQAEFRIGSPGEEIVTAGQECGAKFIVCTTHGTGGWAPQWFGSVTDHIIRHAAEPVLAMSAAATVQTTTPGSMLVLLDGSVLSEEVLPEVISFAKMFNARVELFRVVSTPWVGDTDAVLARGADQFEIDGFAQDAKHQLDAVAAHLRLQGLRVTSTVDVHHSPTRRILEHIERSNPEVVALATHARGISRLLVGSVADKVLRAGARPMLCVRPRHRSAFEDVRQLEADTAGIA